MEDDGPYIPLSPFSVVLVGLFLSTAIMLMIYHCIVVRFCNRGRDSRPLRQQQEEGTPNGLERSFIQLIPVYKYRKADSKGDDGDNMCAVCLCEFKEGEDVRRLPECLHSFHISCIDMWFYSHSNCPLCRAEMTPSPLRPSAPLDSG